MIIELNKTCSTNDYLLNQISKKELTEGTIVIARNQTKGKGQQGNSWVSDENKNLTFSLLLKPVSIAPEDMFMISKAISIGIIKYLNSLGNEFKIKWPNDIYHNNKKVCGILVENRLSGAYISHSVIGIGLNINQTIWPAEIPNPVSLKNIFEKEFDLKTCLQDLTYSIMEWYSKLLKGEHNTIQHEYFSSIFRKNGFHKYSANNIEFYAEIISISNDGKMTLRKKDNSEEGFYFKEVEFIIPIS